MTMPGVASSSFLEEKFQLFGHSRGECYLRDGPGSLASKPRRLRRRAHQ